MVGGNDLQLYSHTGIKFIFGKQSITNNITSDDGNFKISTLAGISTSLRNGCTMSYTDKNIELSKYDESKVIISHGINLLTDDEDKPLTIRNTKHNTGKDIKIPYGMQFEATDDYLVITAINASGLLKHANIPWE
jgi:hypothetical protein